MPRLDIPRPSRTRCYIPDLSAVLWLRCPSRGQGSVQRTHPREIVPGPRPGRSLKNLPADVEQAWDEARSAYSVAAYTAAEVICRKILMHIAVDKVGAQAGRQFTQYVDDLENAGYITTGLKPVVDQVRKRGNVANHKLPPSTEQDSLTTLKITEHLLEAIYELPGMGTRGPPAFDRTHCSNRTGNSERAGNGTGKDDLIRQRQSRNRPGGQPTVGGDR